MKLKFLIPFIVSAFMLTGCDLFSMIGKNVDKDPVATITLSENNLELGPGESKTLTAEVTLRENASFSTAVLWKSSNTNVVTVSSPNTSAKSKVITVKSTAAGNQTATITAYLKANNDIKATCSVKVKTIAPTAITISSESLELAPGKNRQLSVSYTPSNANTNTAVTWTSSNTSVATVDSSGKVSVKSTASVGQTSTITAKLTNLPSITASCNLTVVDQADDFYTVLIYMCGANLESDYANVMDTDHDGTIDWYGWGLATMDIMEILQVPNKPDDINIVIETGGANAWTNNTNTQYPDYSANYSDGYDINASKLQRHHVNSSGKIELDQTLSSYTSMALSSTLQGFLEYGLNNYPAEKTALILWNHGGGLRGVCFDEKRNSGQDGLTADEVATAVSNALNNTGHAGEKLEWIGYDACLMAVQDIADVNSQYFNYMVASEQTESGEGWDYDTWVDDLYAYKNTPQILTAICDGFVDSNNYYYDAYGHVQYNPNYSGNDQTLAYYDLSKMDAYRTAWENMANQLKTKVSSNSNGFNNLIDTCQTYGDDYAYAYGLVDAKDFLNKLESNSTFNPGSSYMSAVKNAFTQLVPHSAKGAGAGNSNGLCMYWTIHSYTSYYNTYSSSTTRFTNWCYLVSNYGR